MPRGRCQAMRGRNDNALAPLKRSARHWRLEQDHPGIMTQLVSSVFVPIALNHLPKLRRFARWNRKSGAVNLRERLKLSSLPRGEQRLAHGRAKVHRQLSPPAQDQGLM